LNPGQQFVELALGVALDDAGDSSREPGFRIDGVELAGFDEGREDRPVLGAADEEGVLAGERDRADG
jgi:hypothetical protein